jgi:hypothetical protein
VGCRTHVTTAAHAVSYGVDQPAPDVGDDVELDGIIAIRVEDARISGIYYVRNPARLSRVGSETALTRR